MGIGHTHTHYGEKDKNSRQLILAILINILLTVVQLIGGIISGSLSLIADALHNFNDAGALIIAFAARRIATRPANKTMTYGFQRAEILGALINSVFLVIVGGYLAYEAVVRFLNPVPIDGWIVVAIAFVALLIDIITALLVYKESKENINMKAAFIHNISDAMASIVVIISGALIILFEVFWVDLVATLIVSAYVIFQSFALIKKSVLIIMQAVPDTIDLNEIKFQLIKVEGVRDANHIHIWQLDDKKIFFEGHFKLNLSRKVSVVKDEIRQVLKEKFGVTHTTIEIIEDGE